MRKDRRDQSQHPARDDCWAGGGGCITRIFALQLNELKRLARTSVCERQLGAVVHNHCARIGLPVADVCDVHRRLHNRHVALRRDDVADVSPPAGELLAWDEIITPCADVVVVVHACIKATPAVRLGRQRGPADVRIAFPPRHPRRSPLAARHPHPAFASVAHPAPVMTRRPAVRFVRAPSPAVVAPHPFAVGVRTPVPVALRLAGLENVAVALDFIPIAVRIQRVVKEISGSRGARPDRSLRALALRHALRLRIAKCALGSTLFIRQRTSFRLR